MVNGISCKEKPPRLPGRGKPPVGALACLVRARVERGWTQAQLGVRLGVSQEMVSAWERGEKPPTRAQVRYLAHLLSIPVLLLEGEVYKIFFGRNSATRL